MPTAAKGPTPTATGWKWCGLWKCWQKDDYAKKIFPGDDSAFITAENGIWISGIFPDFETAERSFEMTPEEAADYSFAEGGTYWINRPRPWEKTL